MSPQHQAHIVVEIGSNRIEVSTGNPKVHSGADHKWGKVVRNSPGLELSLLDSDEFRSMTSSLCSQIRDVHQSAFGIELLRVEATGAAKEFNTKHQGAFSIAVYRASIKHKIPPLVPLIHRDPAHLHSHTVYGEQILRALYSEKSLTSDFFKQSVLDADILVIRSNQTDVIRAGKNFTLFSYETPVHFKFNFQVNDNRIAVLNQSIEVTSFTFSQICKNQKINPRLIHRDVIIVGKAARQLLDIISPRKPKSFRKGFSTHDTKQVFYSINDLKILYKSIQEKYKSGDIDKEDAARILRNLAFLHSILIEKNDPDARIILSDTKPVYGLFDVFKSYDSKFSMRIAEAGVTPFFETFFNPKDLINLFVGNDPIEDKRKRRNKTEIFIESITKELLKFQTMLEAQGYSDINAVDLFMANTYRGVTEEVKEQIKGAFYQRTTAH